MTAEARFRAMGSDAHVIAVGGTERDVDRIRARIEQLEGRWSRFIESSEVSVLNRGEHVELSDDTRLLLARAAEGVVLSGGSFDPYVSGGLDPGGIGKGLAADLVVGDALADGVRGVCVNLGGDLRVAGESPSGDGWTIAVEHPRLGQLALVGIADGAVATSTTLLRLGHIIDPKTGLSTHSDLDLATVVSAEGWTSEVLAKAVLLRGSQHPFDLLGGTPAVALAVDVHDRVQTSDGFDAFTHRPRAQVR